jgi:ATP-dependent Lhr-like helicase
MGIDIGQGKSVAQLDPPFSVSSLRQRLGRSGRRGEAAVLRMFVTEPELHGDLAPQDTLRLDLFQAVAVTNLLLNKWCEPPVRARLHLSTLIQQVLSLIAQYGGLTAVEAWKITCHAGPFRNVDAQMFGELLRGLAAHNILMQSADGTLLHAPA